MSKLTLDYVIAAEGDWEFKEDVKQLARLLKAIETQNGTAAENVAAQIFKLARIIKLDAETIKQLIAPLADITDAVENAMEIIIKDAAGRVEAYVTPPPGDATQINIILDKPTEQE